MITKIPRRARSAGLTLVELLVVMGLLTAFTYMAIRLLSGGLQLWKVADESRDLDERARAALDLLRRDLWLVDGSEESRFVVDYGDLTTSGEPASVCRLRFVRTMNRVDDARLRGGFANRASAQGAVPGDTKAQAPTGSETTASPSSSIGLLEVAWAPAPDPSARDASLLQLRRSVLPSEPDGSAASIFTKDFFTKPKKGFYDSSMSADVISGVLYFGVALGSQRTRNFDRPRENGGPENVWDSTRFDFISHKASGFSKFTFASELPLPARERVFPRRARVSLLLAREDADRRSVRLAKDVDAKSSDLVLDDPTPLEVGAGDIVKIGGELAEVVEAAPRLLKIRARGTLGSKVSDHKTGTTVQRGKMFILEVPIDVWRDADLYEAR